jgi:hypothetical protein
MAGIQLLGVPIKAKRRRNNLIEIVDLMVGCGARSDRDARTEVFGDGDQVHRA